MHRAEVLEGLAANENLSEDQLVRLAQDPGAAYRMTWGRKGVLPDSVVDAIHVHRNASVHLGGNRVSAEKLRELLTDPAYRAAREEFAAVDADYHLEWLVDLKGVDRAVLARDPDPDVRKVVAKAWWQRSPEVHRQLLTDPDLGVREAAASTWQLRIPPDLREEFLESQPHVVEYAALTPERAMELAHHSDVAMRDALAINPALPAKVIDVLLADPEAWVRRTVVVHRAVPEDKRRQVWAELQADRDSMIGFNARVPEWLRDEPLDVRLSYLDSPIAEFRLMAAVPGDLPPEAYARLDDDPSVMVRREVARRPDVPADALVRLVREHGEVRHHVGYFHVDHTNFPRSAFLEFADSADPRLRELSLRWTDLPPEVLGRLAGDPDGSVRSAAAEHPRLGIRHMRALIEDDSPDVAAKMAEHAPRSVVDDVLRQAGL